MPDLNTVLNGCLNGIRTRYIRISRGKLGSINFAGEIVSSTRFLHPFLLRYLFFSFSRKIESPYDYYTTNKR